LKTHHITVEGAWPALKEKGMAGVLPAASAYPVHAFASDLHYTLLPSGVLTCLFEAEAESFAGLFFDRILPGLPEAGGLQVYSHHPLDGPPGRFLALSAPVAYQSPFSPLGGFGSLMRRHALARELMELEARTREAYDTLLASVQGEAQVRLLSNPSPLIGALGPLRLGDAALESGDSVTYNLSYLLLGPARLALLVEFNAFPKPGGPALPLPAPGLEYLAATCIHRPSQEDLARLNLETEDYLTFLHFFRKAALSRAGSLPSVELPGDGGVALKGKVLAKHYVLLFGTSLAVLRARAQEYFQALSRQGVSFHASMIRTRENYGHLYPGHYKLFSDGVRLEEAEVPAVLGMVQP
jgi:hypothetical protein